MVAMTLLIVPIVLAIIAFVVLFSIVAIVAAFIGGITVALLVKNKLVKKLLFIGFCTLFLVGFLCLIPFAAMYLNLSATFFAIILSLIYVSIALLAIAGIKIASSIKNNIIKVLLVILFCFILVADISFSIFTVIAHFLLV